jgi:hypothetical protein
MSSQVWVDARLPTVRVEGVRSYLLGRGWTLQPYPGPELLVFGGPTDDDGQPVVQVLPSSERMRDYPLRLEELIAALAVLEDRPTSDIVTDLLAAQPSNGAPAPEEARKGAQRVSD